MENNDDQRRGMGEDVVHSRKNTGAMAAKVKLNGVGWPVQVELADAYEVCRAIAAEGADDGK